MKIVSTYKYPHSFILFSYALDQLKKIKPCNSQTGISITSMLQGRYLQITFSSKWMKDEGVTIAKEIVHEINAQLNAIVSYVKMHLMHSQRLSRN